MTDWLIIAALFAVLVVTLSVPSVLGLYSDARSDREER